MKLEYFHQFFIFLTILLNIYFLKYQVKEYMKVDSNVNLVTLITSIIILVILVIYIGFLLRKVKK